MNSTLSLHIARVWLAGKSPWAPGTCGSFVAVLLAPLVFMPLPLPLRVLMLLALLALGVWASGRAEKILGVKDPSEVVIDEVFGQWLTFLPFVSLGFWGYAAGFALFRLFDIAKPWPVRQLEAIGGGFGIMIDDGAAGVYAMLCLALLVLLG